MKINRKPCESKATIQCVPLNAAAEGAHDVTHTSNQSLASMFLWVEKR